jgi:hypothetical protein
MDTKPFRPEGVPILIGGSTEVAAQRAGRLGDGWYPYVISPEDFGQGVETIRTTAKAAGRDPGRIEISVWPASFDFMKTFDLGFVQRYVDHGAHRLVISQGESMTTDIQGQRDFIRRYQDQILAKL